MKPTLTLKREALAALTDDELGLLAGGALTRQTCPVNLSLLHAYCPSALTCPTE